MYTAVFSILEDKVRENFGVKEIRKDEKGQWYLNNTRRVGTVCKDLGADQTLADLPPPGWKAWIPLPAAATPGGSSSRAH